MILVIDNYDSFTYNLVQYLLKLGKEIVVYRNDEITADEIGKMKPDHILLSPGPSNPDHAGVCLDVVQKFHRSIPIMGVCLGHQIIAQSFGTKIVKAKQPMHGKISEIVHDGKSIFKGIPSPYKVTRYHSLVAERETLPDCFEISAETMDGEIMAIRHKEFSVEGVQFHPESILTEYGLEILGNFFGAKMYAYQ